MAVKARRYCDSSPIVSIKGWFVVFFPFSRTANKFHVQGKEGYRSCVFGKEGKRNIWRVSSNPPFVDLCIDRLGVLSSPACDFLDFSLF